MAHKIFNKFKEPKFAEFSRKDLVVDIKSGTLYYKSNLGVHRVPSEVSSTHFGTPPTSPVSTGRSTFKLDDQRDGDSAITGSLILIGKITASGNISASYTSTGSFGSAMLTNLPTTEPLVSGALWLSGSGGGSSSGSKYLMVFNG